VPPLSIHHRMFRGTFFREQGEPAWGGDPEK
jgi:hypothetical protein